METNKTTRTDIYAIDPRNIIVRPCFNSRVDFGDIEELASQIAKDGVLNPLHVQRIKDAEGNEKFILVDGERRYRAVMHNIENGIDIPKVNAILVSNKVSEEDLIRIQIQCNEGKNFTEYEYGIAYKKLKDLKMSNEDIAKFVGKQLWHVTVCLTHLERPEEVQRLLQDKKITGVDVRHVFQAHKDDDETALQEILNLENKRQEREAAALSEKEALDAQMKELLDKKDNGENVKKEITSLKKEQKKNENEIKKSSRISLADLDMESNTIQAKDSMTIKQALSILVNKYMKPVGANPDNVNVTEILKRLKDGEFINDIIFDYSEVC